MCVNVRKIGSDKNEQISVAETPDEKILHTLRSSNFPFFEHLVRIVSDKIFFRPITTLTIVWKSLLPHTLGQLVPFQCAVTDTY